MKLSFALCVLAALPAFSQEVSARIPVGSEVEITTQAAIQDKLRGRVRGVDSVGVHLAMTRAGSMLLLPWDKARTVRWSPGRRHALGAFDGAWFGAVLGIMTYVNGYPFNQVGPDVARIKHRLLVSSATIFLGSTAIGAAIGSHRWRQVPLPPPRGGEVALRFAPTDEVLINSTTGFILGREVEAGDSLRLRTEGGPMSLPWRNVGDLQVRGGKRRGWGILYGAGTALILGTLAESFVDFSGKERFAHLAVGGAIGYRFLSPEGWISLPQPTR